VIYLVIISYVSQLRGPTRKENKPIVSLLHSFLLPVSYGTDTDVAVPCGGYTSKEDLLTSIDEMSFAAGSVNPVGAIGEITNMFAQGGRSDARKIVFIFINGRSGNFPASEATEVMATARKAGLEIYVIGEAEV